jgi:hypothetical protein
MADITSMPPNDAYRAGWDAVFARKCGRGYSYACGNPASAEPHACPFKGEVHEDNTTLCNCCATCTRECADDV